MYNPDGSMRAPQRRPANSGGGALSFGFGDSTPSDGSTNSSKENSPRRAEKYSPNKPDMRAAGVKTERGEKKADNSALGLDRRHAEMTGHNVINPADYQGLGERSISTAKHNALYKSNVFNHESNSPKTRRPPVQVSEQKMREMGGSNVFAGDQAMDVAPRASISIKQPPGGGSNISFGSSSEPVAPSQQSARRKPPGGGSSFIFG